jgi:hypothetical protein
MKELRVEYYRFSSTSGNYFKVPCSEYRVIFKNKGRHETKGITILNTIKYTIGN